MTHFSQQWFVPKFAAISSGVAYPQLIPELVLLTVFKVWNASSGVGFGVCGGGSIV